MGTGCLARPASDAAGPGRRRRGPGGAHAARTERDGARLRVWRGLARVEAELVRGEVRERGRRASATVLLYTTQRGTRGTERRGQTGPGDPSGAPGGGPPPPSPLPPARASTSAADVKDSPQPHDPAWLGLRKTKLCLKGDGGGVWVGGVGKEGQRQPLSAATAPTPVRSGPPNPPNVPTNPNNPLFSLDVILHPVHRGADHVHEGPGVDQHTHAARVDHLVESSLVV